MPGPKTNERPGTRAVLRHSSISASKARQVLDLIRGEDVDRASQILRSTPRSAAVAVSKAVSYTHLPPLPRPDRARRP